MEFAQQLQQTAFARWVGESGSLLGYPTILFLHTIGMATIAGLNASINLRILGVAPGLPLRLLLRFYPWMWAAFGITLASGLALLIADAETKLGSTIFYVKLLFVLLSIVTLQMIRKRVLSVPETEQRLPPNAKMFAITSFIFLLATTTAGRLMAYLQ